MKLFYECRCNYGIGPGMDMKEFYTHLKEVNVRCLRIHKQAAYPSQLEQAICVFSQLDIIKKLDSEPLARQMLINLLNYLTGLPPAQK